MSLHHLLGHHGTDAMMMGNDSSHHPSADVDFAESETISSWILVILCGVLMCVAVPSNLLVLAAFLTDGKLRTYGNLFIINLCVADLGVGAINLPLTVLEEGMKLAGRGWPFGPAPCHLAKTCQHIFFSASIVTILVICNDRYHAVRHPLAHLQDRTTKGALLRIAFAWGLAGFVWLSFILAWGLAEGDRSLPANVCTAMYNTHHYSTGAAIALAMWIPYPAILIMYCRVYSTIRAVSVRRIRSVRRRRAKRTDGGRGGSQSRSGHEETANTELTGSVTAFSRDDACVRTIAAMSSVQISSAPLDRAAARTDGQDAEPRPTLNPTCPHQLKDQPDDKKPGVAVDGNGTPITIPPSVPVSYRAIAAASSPEAFLRRSSSKSGGADSKKATLTLTLVVASYAICWLPYGVIVPITSICKMHPGAFPPLPAYYNAAVIGFSMCQSAINPFCYAAAQPAIRHAIRRLLTCYRCRSKAVQ